MICLTSISINKTEQLCEYRVTMGIGMTFLVGPCLRDNNALQEGTLHTSSLCETRQQFLHEKVVKSTDFFGWCCGDSVKSQVARRDLWAMSHSK